MSAKLNLGFHACCCQKSNDGEGDKSYFIRNLEFHEFLISIYQEYIGDVGCVIWDSAIVACHYFVKQQSFWKGKKVLELGAGTGACSILLAALGANVIATDLPGRISLIEKNIQKNAEVVLRSGGVVKAEVLSWNDSSSKPLQFDVIVLVDAIYYLKALEGLVKILLRSTVSTIICCYEVRDVGEPAVAQKRFFDLLSPSFVVCPVANENLDPLYRSSDIKVLHLVRI